MPHVYTPRRVHRDEFLTLRGLRHRVLRWGQPLPGRPPLVMVHGWMDVGASFQFVVDALAAQEGFDRYVIAPDWRICRLTGNALERYSDGDRPSMWSPSAWLGL